MAIIAGVRLGQLAGLRLVNILFDMAIARVRRLKTRTKALFSSDGAKNAFVGGPGPAADSLFVIELSGSSITGNSALHASSVHRAPTARLRSSSMSSRAVYRQR